MIEYDLEDKLNELEDDYFTTHYEHQDIKRNIISREESWDTLEKNKVKLKLKYYRKVIENKTNLPITFDEEEYLQLLSEQLFIEEELYNLYEKEKKIARKVEKIKLKIETFGLK